MKSEVYFVKVNALDTQARARALERLLDAAGRFLTYKKAEFVPVKITIGDSPCVYHLKPELVKVIISRIKEQGAKPFLFDTSVIYHGSRQNAVDHLNLAESKGFGQAKTGCPFIIADGLLGQDGKELAVNGPEIKKVKVPSFVGMIEQLLVLSHVTGHIVSGYAAAIKNVGMGMSCRPTKQLQHSGLKPSVITKSCTACECCIAVCPVNAITLKEGKALINQQACIGCAECLCACKFNAITINWQEDPQVFCRRMVDVTLAILSRFKQAFFLNFALDITKECDCISAKDEKMAAENIGILASSDILSLDKATADLALEHKKTDYFADKLKIYQGMFEYAAKQDLGSLEYRLVRLE